MSENNFSDKAYAVSGYILLIIIIAAFVWSWFGTPRPDENVYRSTANLTIPDLSGVEKRASSLLEGLNNNSGMPISAPADKMGREDPFASL